MKFYVNGKFVEKDEAKVSVLDRGLIYGDGIYEVIRIYKDKKPFLLDWHMERLANSAKEIDIPLEKIGGIAEIKTMIMKAINQGPSEGALYLEITRGVEQKRAHGCPKNLKPTIIAWIQEPTVFPDEFYETGVKVITHPDWRPAITEVKHVNRLMNEWISQKAEDEGALEAVLIRDGMITEATSDNVFLVMNGGLFTPALNKGILPGITRRFVIQLAEEEGIPVNEVQLPISSFRKAEEVFLSGTGLEVMPVRSVDDMDFDAPGPVTSILREKFSQKLENMEVRNDETKTGQGGN